MALATNACLGQPQYVAAQDVQPLPYGLFSVSTVLDGGDGHWQQGTEWEPQPCGPASIWGCPTCAQNNALNAPNKTVTSGVASRQAFPYVVYGSFSCSPIGNWDRGFERARQMLESGAERAVEGEFALATVSHSPSLTDAAAINITPGATTPVSVVNGIALLEQYIGANGSGQGVILATRREATIAISNHLIRPNDAHTMLQTRLDTPVAALGGFNGLMGPNGVAATTGQAWMFALGSRPVVRRSGITMNPDVREQALRTTNNNFQVFAEQTYSVGFDCFAVGVLVNAVPTP